MAVSLIAVITRELALNMNRILNITFCQSSSLNLAQDNLASNQWSLCLSITQFTSSRGGDSSTYVCFRKRLVSYLCDRQYLLPRQSQTPTYVGFTWHWGEEMEQPWQSMTQLDGIVTIVYTCALYTCTPVHLYSAAPCTQMQVSSRHRGESSAIMMRWDGRIV